ncbi:MAG: glycosyltransferase family 2 protein [Acidobacteria bacterium]|nr:glycosyltransferase family 2 protein [Acidobacteriota bacterium]
MTSAKPTVSVVVPVYNALPYLTDLLDSIAAQDMDPNAIDVVTVDDGSTDGSAAVLDAYSRLGTRLTVIHQANSKRPGRPRNVGLRASTSKYVFFADADDRLAPKCLRRLVAYAEDHGSDVVIPKMVPLEGRGFPTAVYEQTRLDADLVTAFRTLFPQKLYRRSLLEEHNIWFPEGIRLDDGNFNAQAYVHAKRISILGDHDYYFLRARKDGKQLSRTERDPSTYTASVVKLFEIVKANVKDATLADQVVLDLYRRKCLPEYDPRRFPLYDASLQDAWIAVHKAVVEGFITEGMEAQLDSPLRERSRFIRRGDRAGLVELIRHEDAPVLNTTVTRTAWTADGLEVALDASVMGRVGLPRQLVCQLVRRDGDGASAFPLTRNTAERPDHGQVARYEGILPYTSVHALVEGAYDLFVTSISGADRLSGRVGWAKGAIPPDERGGLRLQVVGSGHVRIRKTTESKASLRGVVRRVAGNLGWRH